MLALTSVCLSGTGTGVWEFVGRRVRRAPEVGVVVVRRGGTGWASGWYLAMTQSSSSREGVVWPWMMAEAAGGTDWATPVVA